LIVPKREHPSTLIYSQPALTDLRRFDRDLSRSQVFLLAKPLM
jgi:hypothetical protein